VFAKQTGHLLVEGGAVVHTDGDIHVSENDADPRVTPVNGQQSTLTVRSGGIVEAQNLFVNEHGRLDGDGGIITANVINQGGLVSPGSSPGVMTIDGNYTQDADGELLIEIAGTDPGVDYDQLIITGDAILDGTLILRFLGGFVPGDGDTFDFLSVAGVFDHDLLDIQIDNLPSSFDTDVAFSNGVFNLTVTGNVIPTPAAAPMAMLLLGALSLTRRRR
jgi:hypothetical protein